MTEDNKTEGVTTTEKDFGLEQSRGKSGGPL